ncbi:MAG: ParB/RepB/Spo0J family partition protein [Candidatus Bathyarchaeia archaeon]
MSSKVKLARVNPKKIQIPEVRVTSVWDPDDYELFKASLEADGIQNPIICVREGETWWLADGRHRLEEALLKGMPYVDVAYKEGTLVDAKLRNLYLNRLRGKTKVSEEVALIRDLYENDGLDLDEIGRRTGMSRELIEQRLAISKADPYVQDMLDEEKIGVGVAFQLSRLPNPEGQIRLLQELVKMPKTPPTSWVRDVVEESLRIMEERARAPEQPEPTIPTRTIRCHFCGQRYEEREVRGFNLCLTCAGVSKDYVQELMRKRKAGKTPEQVLAEKIAAGGEPTPQQGGDA